MRLSLIPALFPCSAIAQQQLQQHISRWPEQERNQILGDAGCYIGIQFATVRESGMSTQRGLSIFVGLVSVQALLLAFWTGT
jgi:hypothetical protein